MAHTAVEARSQKSTTAVTGIFDFVIGCEETMKCEETMTLIRFADDVELGETVTHTLKSSTAIQRDVYRPEEWA